MPSGHTTAKADERGVVSYFLVEPKDAATARETLEAALRKHSAAEGVTLIEQRIRVTSSSPARLKDIAGISGNEAKDFVTFSTSDNGAFRLGGTEGAILNKQGIYPGMLRDNGGAVQSAIVDLQTTVAEAASSGVKAVATAPLPNEEGNIRYLIVEPEEAERARKVLTQAMRENGAPQSVTLTEHRAIIDRSFPKAFRELEGQEMVFFSTSDNARFHLGAGEAFPLNDAGIKAGLIVDDRNTVQSAAAKMSKAVANAERGISSAATSRTATSIAADDLHEQWRAAYRAQNGEDAARWKPMKPESAEWVAQKGDVPASAIRQGASGPEINIARCRRSLPERTQLLRLGP